MNVNIKEITDLSDDILTYIRYIISIFDSYTDIYRRSIILDLIGMIYFPDLEGDEFANIATDTYTKYIEIDIQMAKDMADVFLNSVDNFDFEKYDIDIENYNYLFYMFEIINNF